MSGNNVEKQHTKPITIVLIPAILLSLTYFLMKPSFPITKINFLSLSVSKFILFITISNLHSYLFLFNTIRINNLTCYLGKGFIYMF